MTLVRGVMTVAWFCRSSAELNWLDSFGSREEAAVDGINDRLSTDLSTTKESAVETLYGVLASLDAVEFKVDIALRVGI